MNSYVIIFSALVLAVSANSVHRSTGWGAPPPPSNIDVELVGALAAAGAGAADASLQVVESASGDASKPASIVSSSGTLAAGEQLGSIVQVATANVPAGATATINEVGVQQEFVGAEGVTADIEGALSANAAISGASDALGWGSLGAEAGTLNVISSRQ